jgi:phytoene synthase
MTVAALEVERAYRHSEQATRQAAANFYYGIRLLPRPKRQAMSAVYAFARRVDDIGDEVGLQPAERLARLGAERALVDGLREGAADRVEDPVAVALAHATALYALPVDALSLLVDGVEMDVTGRRYATFDELVGYCRCVAGTVGRLCLGVFGSRPHPDAARYADTLGIALQQTNILRDIREDLLSGRVYLPADELERFGVELAVDEHGVLSDPDGRLSALIAFSAARAQRWYDEGLRLVPLLDWRSAASCRAMAGIYRELLARIAAQPSAVFDRRLSLSGRQKAGVAARALTGLGRP